MISWVIWLCCLPAVAGYALLTFGAIGAVLKGGEVASLPVVAFVYAAFVCGWFAWYALLKMNRAWLRGQRLSAAWPVCGTISAVVGLVPLAASIWPIALVSPGVLLAIHLTLWHLGMTGKRSR